MILTVPGHNPTHITCPRCQEALPYQEDERLICECGCRIEVRRVLPEVDPLACPDCGGRGRFGALVDGVRPDGSHWGGVREMECRDCGGSGKLTLEQAAQRRAMKKRGDALRDWRMNQDESLRMIAGRFGVTPQEWSRMEQGRQEIPAEIEEVSR